MKVAVLGVATAMVLGASATIGGGHHHHKKHELKVRGLTTYEPEATCGCTTIYSTVTGEGSLIFPSYTATPTYVPTYSPTGPPVAPTPLVTILPTPGVYTISATTITLTESTVVCAATSAPVAPGTYTAGGVTTVVETSTSVVVPYAAITTSSGYLTSTILTTTYVCPSAGTYTIAPLTTTISESTVWVYPTAATYTPGTYTQAEVVTTITATDYVIFCPFTSPAPVVAPTTYVAAPAPAETYPAAVETYPAAVETYPAAAETSPASSLGNSGNQWAMTYTPYTTTGQCKDSASVEVDISLIASSGFTTVRVYSTDCSGLQNIGAACEKYGVKMILGVFIEESGISGAQEQVTEIVQWAQWGLVELIVIGNEAIFNGYCSASALASFITSSKQAFSSAGYSGPCTTTEPVDVWQANTGALCEVVDVVGANIHPFFNGNYPAAQAGSFVAGQLDIVDSLCVGKSGINLETGWPSAGECNNEACPTPENQEAALKSITEAAGGKSVILSFANDLWKNPGPLDVETNWGAIQCF